MSDSIYRDFVLMTCPNALPQPGEPLPASAHLYRAKLLTGETVECRAEREGWRTASGRLLDFTQIDEITPVEAEQ